MGAALPRTVETPADMAKAFALHAAIYGKYGTSVPGGPGQREIHETPRGLHSLVTEHDRWYEIEDIQERWGPLVLRFADDRLEEGMAVRERERLIHAPRERSLLEIDLKTSGAR